MCSSVPVNLIGQSSVEDVYPNSGKVVARKPVGALIPFYPDPTVSSTGTRGVLGSQSFRIVCPQFDSKSFPRTPAAASGGGV
jgi:hypothetical protein